MALYDVSTTEKKAAPSLVAGGTLYADSPVGTILPFGGVNPPSGFLLCQGQEVSKTTYAELYAVIGDSFGTASDATKFVIPDMRESVPKGAGLTGHTVGNHLDADGLAVGEFLDDRVQEHTHSSSIFTGGAGFSAGTGATRYDGASGINTGRSGATTEVKSVGVNYIIKAKMVAVPADFLAKVQPKTLDTPIGGETTVEGALGALAIGKVPVAHEALTNNDCNTFAEGFHVFRTTGNSTNRPVTRIGLIYSFGYKTGVQLRLTQLYMSNDETPNDVIAYIRGARSSDGGETWTWGDWKELITDSDIDAKSIITQTSSVSSGSDCNDLTDKYTQYAVGDGVANRPTTGTESYILVNIRSSSTTATLSQIAYRVGGTEVFRRRYFANDNTWSSWEKLVTESDLSVRTGTVSYSAVAGNGWSGDLPITFSSPMPDTNYNVVVDTGTTGHMIVSEPFSKSTSGCKINIYNGNDTAQSGSINYKAFKLPS